VIVAVGALAGASNAHAGDAQVQQQPHVEAVKPDLMTTGIEVTQGAQQTITSYQDADGTLDPSLCASQPSLPVRDVSDGGITGAQSYQGVLLQADHRKTVVRVFAHALVHNLTTPLEVKHVEAVLEGSRDGHRLPFSPLHSVEGPRRLTGELGVSVTCLDRADPKGAWTFELPRSWRHGTITLKARALPDRYLYGRGGECDTRYCAQDNSLELRGVRFRDTGYVTVTPVALTYRDASGTQHSPTVTPGQELVQPKWTAPTRLRYRGGDDSTYAGSIDITEIATDPAYAYKPSDDNAAQQAKRRTQCSAIEDALEYWADNHAHGDVTFGVFDPAAVVCLGVAGGYLRDGDVYPVVNPDSLAHEMGHNFGRDHSDSVAKGCGGNGEDWPPDGRGYMRGIETDTRTGSAGGNGAYKIVLSGNLTPGNPFGFGQDPILYDMMSYCGALDRRFTLSDTGWDEAFNGVISYLKAFHPARLGSAASARRVLRRVVNPVLRVRASDGPDGVQILGIQRLAAGPSVPAGDSPLTAVFTAANGSVLGSIPMTGRPFVTHDGGNVDVYAADLPIGTTPVKRIDITRAGVVVASRTRSPNVPQVALTAPAAGTAIGADGVTVTWTATDADHDPLRVAVGFSQDGGKSWRQLWVGPNTGSAAIPRRQLTTSSDARLRVLASDGFNASAAPSGALTVTAVAPLVRFAEPIDGLTIRRGGLVALQADGQDGDGNPIPASQVKWYDGNTLLGNGLAIDRILKPGTHHIRLEVAAGAVVQSTSLAGLITVAGDAPHVLRFRGPVQIGVHRKRLRFTIATTETGWLRAAGKSVRVGPTPRKVTLPITPGSTDLELPIKLHNASGTTHSTIVVARGP
jgi:hypothetical protein